MYQCKDCGARLDPCEKCDCIIQNKILQTTKDEIENLKLEIKDKGIENEIQTNR